MDVSSTIRMQRRRVARSGPAAAVRRCKDRKRG